MKRLFTRADAPSCKLLFLFETDLNSLSLDYLFDTPGQLEPIRF